MSTTLSTLERDLMNNRARELAARTTTDNKEERSSLVVEVAVRGSRLGLPVDGLWRIIQTPPFSPLPTQPQWIMGVAVINGELISVLDTALLTMKSASIGNGSAPFLAVVEDGQRRRLGLLIDEVLGHRELFERDLAEALSGNDSPESGPIVTTTTDLLSLIDLKKLYEMPAIRMRAPEGHLLPNVPSSRLVPSRGGE